MGERINIVEVGPRDGWQNLKQLIPTETKKQLIDGLVDAGAREIEITSFVSPKAIPQMADAAEIAAYCVEKHPEVTLLALVPNFRGVQKAWEAGIRKVTYVISLSESHNKANIRHTHEESFAELEQIVTTYPEMTVVGGMATILGCPYEGFFPIEKQVAFAKRIASYGVKDFGIADTIGIATPDRVRDTVKALQDALPDCNFQIHIHDTRNMGITNSLAAIECGIRDVQSTLGGLGGCPFAPGASGNTATEDLVYMLENMGYETGYDFEKLVALSRLQKKLIPDGIYSGHQMNIQPKNPPCC